MVVQIMGTREPTVAPIGQAPPRAGDCCGHAVQFGPAFGMTRVCMKTAVAFLWLYAASNKAAHFSDFRVAVQSHGLVPSSLVLHLVILLILIEMLVGCALLYSLVERTVSYVPILTSILLLSFFLLYALSMSRRPVSPG